MAGAVAVAGLVPGGAAGEDWSVGHGATSGLRMALVLGNGCDGRHRSLDGVGIAWSGDEFLEFFGSEKMDAGTFDGDDLVALETIEGAGDGFAGAADHACYLFVG